MFERVDQAHIKRAFQAGIEERIPIGALCHILQVHVLWLSMGPEFGGRFGKRRRWGFFLRLGRTSFSIVLPRPALHCISSTHFRILREDEVDEMRITPKRTTKLLFEFIVVAAIGSQNDVTSR